MSKNCSQIKKAYYECVKTHNLNIDYDILKFRASKIQDINSFSIPEEIMKKCKSHLLAKCLMNKYEIQIINDKELSDHYSLKFNDIKRKIEEDSKKP